MLIYHYQVADTKNGSVVFPEKYELLGVPEKEIQNIIRILNDAGYETEETKLEEK